MSFITYPLNNIEYSAEDAELFHVTRTSGIYAQNSFGISVSGANNTVVIGKGIAWIKNGEFSGKVAAIKSETSMNLGVADASLPRIDTIAIQFDANANETRLVHKIGVASSTPVAPGLVRTESVYELHLYQVYRAAGAVSIAWSNIVDLRLSPDYCGLMADSVTSVDTSAIYAKINELANNYEENINRMVDAALQEAKDSGEFDGEPGLPGKDYVLTDADKEEIAGMVDVSGGSDRVLLWQVAKPTSTFEAQTIQLGDLSAYSEVIIVTSNGVFGCSVGLAGYGNAGYGTCYMTVSDGDDVLYRRCDVYPSGSVDFESCRRVTIADGDTGTADGYVYPARIYGVRKVY